MLKTLGTKRLKLKYEKLVTNFDFNLRRYAKYRYDDHRKGVMVGPSQMLPATSPSAFYILVAQVKYIPMTWRAISASPTARHVIGTHLNPRILRKMASYDSASNIYQALCDGTTEAVL